MIEIKQKDTGEVLATIDADSLAGADLSEMDLQGADMHGLDMPGVNFLHSDLSGADLSNANLERALLQGARLYKANLREANLSHANAGTNSPGDRVILSGADLTNAIFACSWYWKAINDTDRDIRRCLRILASIYFTLWVIFLPRRNSILYMS